jgi:enoyl-CoA hydratase
MIQLGNQDGVAILRMADGKANAMTTEFCEEMTERFEQVRTSSARAVVMVGSGSIFSAGVDLLRLQEGGRPYIRKFLPALGAMFETVFSHPKPVVAAINGHAVAGGCVLACAADKRLMARDTGRIGVTELLVGVPFPAIAMEIMRHATAPQYFVDAIFSGSTYPPSDAVVRGLVDDLVDPAVLLDRAVAAAKVLAAVPPEAFVLTKRQTRQPALERLESVGRAVDTVVEEIWTAPETLARIRDYVSRTFKRA